MPFVMNSLETPVNTQAHGKWFQWKPRQIKEIQNESLFMFFTQNRAEEGLVGIPDYIMELDKSSQDFKDFIEDRRKEGVEKRIQKLSWIINNLEQSLRYDMELKNMKADPSTYASKGEVNAYKELATLKEYEHKQHLNVAEEIKKLKEVIANGGSSIPDSRADNSGRTSPAQPAKAGK